jgi:hypothetical protein
MQFEFRPVFCIPGTLPEFKVVHLHVKANYRTQNQRSRLSNQRPGLKSYDCHIPVCSIDSEVDTLSLNNIQTNSRAFYV